MQGGGKKAYIESGEAMKLHYRKFINGDEIAINNLYRKLSGIDRSKEKFEWEWIKTWDGQGEIHLLFDEECDNQNNLVAQYSLIPIPFSVFGSVYLAGKTENCMCHPNYQKKNIYLSHEKQCFEIAKNRFKIFYTTAGGGSAWAAAAIRRKIGYSPFDSWSINYFCLNHASLNNYIMDKIRIIKIMKSLISCASFIICKYCKMRLVNRRSNILSDIIDEKSVRIDELDTFWVKNKKYYGVTIDRSKDYMAWRLVKNPHLKYVFLLLRMNDLINGYLIYHIDKNKIMHVDDIVVEKKDSKLVGFLIDDSISIAVEKNLSGIVCRTLKGNMFLRKSLYRKGFVDLRWYAFYQDISKIKKQFLVYTSDDINLDKKSWYITNLATEGRE